MSDQTRVGTVDGLRLKAPGPAPSPSLPARLEAAERNVREALDAAREFGCGPLTAALYGALGEISLAAMCFARATAPPPAPVVERPHRQGLVRRKRVRVEEDGAGAKREVREMVGWCPVCFRVMGEAE